MGAGIRDWVRWGTRFTTRRATLLESAEWEHRKALWQRMSRPFRSASNRPPLGRGAKLPT